MAKNRQSQNFLGGVAVLAAAAVIVKLISAVYKIPLGNILDDEGMGHFNMAYNVYNFLLQLSTAGFPLALSKLTSEALALGRGNQVRRPFRGAAGLFFVLGLTASAIMFFGAAPLSELMHDSLAYYPIRVLSPAVFFVCLIGCCRGYTQGRGNMVPTGLSQILEAACKLVVGLGLAWYVMKVLRAPVEIGAAAAIFGVTTGSVVAMLVLGVWLLRHRLRGNFDDRPDGSGAILKRLVIIGVPITAGSSVMSIITLVDTSNVLGRLQTIPELADSAATLFGQYQFGMNLINLPPSFVFPVTMSLIPFAAAAITRKDAVEADRIVSSAFRIVAVLAIPAGVGLSVLGGSALLMLYPAQYTDALAAGPHMRWLGIACIFICLMNLTNAILQTYGKEHLPIITVIIGGITKIILNYVLVGNPAINIHGAPISTLCCYAVIVMLNLAFVWKYSLKKPHYLQLFAKPVLASVLMGGAAWAVHGLTLRVLTGGEYAYGANALATIIGIGAGVVVYAILVIALQILRAEDLRSMPHGEKLAALLHLK